MTYYCKHFKIQELVSKAVYDYYKSRYGEKFLWNFFEEEYLMDLDTIREARGSAIYINNWHLGGNLQQCGLRSNIEQLTKDHTSKSIPYLGGHNLAKGFDLHDGKGDNKALHKLVCNLISKKKLKKLKRVENIVSTPNWTHTDGLQTPDGSLQIFNI